MLFQRGSRGGNRDPLYIDRIKRGLKDYLPRSDAESSKEVSIYYAIVKSRGVQTETRDGTKERPLPLS